MTNFIEDISKTKYLNVINHNVDFLYTQYPFVLIFGKSHSPKYPIIVKIIQNIPHKKIDVDKKEYYIVGLSTSEDHLKILDTLCSLLGTLTNTYIFYNGQKYYMNEIHSMIDCYMTSRKCTDYRAHCWKCNKTRSDEDSDFIFSIKIKPNPKLVRKIVEFTEIIYPCSKLTDFYYNQVAQGITIKDAYQAYTINSIYCVCPSFNLDNFSFKQWADEIEKYE